MTVTHLEVFIRHQKVLAEQHPQWYQEFEDIDPFVADRADVEDLVRRAPTEFASGMLCGILMFRQQLAAMTGREF
ncbi:MAG TPA: hypothetical protein VN259_09040 [Xanthomonadales bacterium]|nr:hypothetical protein [Xanthomonadales bacterium]